MHTNTDTDTDTDTTHIPTPLPHPHRPSSTHTHWQWRARTIVLRHGCCLIMLVWKWGCTLCAIFVPCIYWMQSYETTRTYRKRSRSLLCPFVIRVTSVVLNPPPPPPPRPLPFIPFLFSSNFPWPSITDSVTEHRQYYTPQRNFTNCWPLVLVPISVSVYN